MNLPHNRKISLPQNRKISGIKNQRVFQLSRQLSASLPHLNIIDDHVRLSHDLSASQNDLHVPHKKSHSLIVPQFEKKKGKKANHDLLHGVRQFNVDAKKGLEHLAKSGCLNGESAKEVADFLFRERRLSKQQIGVVLGGHKDFNKQVLFEYVRLHEFTNLILVTALRQFLWSFR